VFIGSFIMLLKHTIEYVKSDYAQYYRGGRTRHHVEMVILLILVSIFVGGVI
jgi:hypothetical protein